MLRQMTVQMRCALRALFAYSLVDSSCMVLTLLTAAVLFVRSVRKLRDADADVVMQAYGAGQFYPGMPGGRFAPPQQQPAAPGYPAAGGYGSYVPPAASG